MTQERAGWGCLPPSQAGPVPPSAWCPAPPPFPTGLARRPVRTCDPSTFQPGLRAPGPTTSPSSPAALPTHRVPQFQVGVGEALRDPPDSHQEPQGPSDKFQVVFVQGRSFLGYILWFNPKKKLCTQESMKHLWSFFFFSLFFLQKYG